MKRINFFATKYDLLLVLQDIEARCPISYTRAGKLSGPVPEIWKSVADLPGVGNATADQAIACDPFLVFEGNPVVRISSRRMIDGTQRFDADQSSNPDSVVLLPGGQWADGVIISGSIATISESPKSQSLMRFVHSSVKNRFTRVRAFWVGPDALAALRNGARLTYAVQSPHEFDLREGAN